MENSVGLELAAQGTTENKAHREYEKAQFEVTDVLLSLSLPRLNKSRRGRHENKKSHDPL